MTATEREPWPDAAKGVLIVLVVLWHTTRKHYRHLPWVPDQALAGWQVVNALLQPVRVPLFFLVSGYLAARAVRRPWGVLLRTRVRRDYWLHLVWFLIASAFFGLVPGLTTSTAHSGREVALGVVVGYSNTWYLYALAAYAVVAKLCLRLPVAVSFGVGVALALLAEVEAVPSLGNTESLLAGLLPFLVGCLLPERIAAVVARATWRRTLLAAAAFLPLVGVAGALGIRREVVATVVLAAAGSAAGLLLAARATRAFPAAALSLGRLGRLTLPVYVLHLPLLALLHRVVSPVALDPGGVTNTLAVLYPAAAVALLVASSLVLHRTLVRLGLGVLFRLPTGGRSPASLPAMTRTRA